MDPRPLDGLDRHPDLEDASQWQAVIERLDPAAMLVRIEARMGTALRQWFTAEDLWQETLLCAWRDRAQLEWRGLPAFRAWLIGIAEHRIRDAAERIAAAKRSGGALRSHALDARDPASEPGEARWPGREQSPPSAVAHLERAQAMRAALEGLPELYREVLRLRLFEEWDRERISAHLGLSLAAVKHRIRLGAIAYRNSLARILSTYASTKAPEEPR
jgi:RNA polymerase sigma factor (sigma-70 family)